jgi:hypothetical protein
MFKKLLKVFAAFLLLTVFCFSGSVSAAEYGTPVYKDGFYIGAQVNYLSLTGDDFDGLTYLYTYDETMFIPEVDPGMGFGALIGLREGNIGMEFSFITSSTTGTVLDEQGDVSMLLFNLYFKFWFDSTSALQPFLLLGFDVNLLTAKDASIEEYYPYAIGDTDLIGMNFDVGAGISYYVTPEIAFNIGANYHLVLFTNVSGVYEESYELDEYITASLINVYGGIIVTLN